MNKAKVQQLKEVDVEEQRRADEARAKKDEENRRKKEDYREVSERALKQREQAEEGIRES